MGCRVIDEFREYISKYIPYFGIYDNVKFPSPDLITSENLTEELDKIEGQGIVKQAIIQQYNEILLYHNVSIEQRNLLAPQCAIAYEAYHNLPTIFYPKFTPLIKEDIVWKTSTEDLPILLGTELSRFGISFSDYKNFINKVVNLCEEFDLREDDILLNPSNVGYHSLFGLRIIDYGLTNSNQLLDF